MTMRQGFNTVKIYPAGGEGADINGAGLDGDWCNLAHFRRVLVRIKTRTLGGNSALTLQQGTSNAGAGAKALGFAEVLVNADYSTPASDHENTAVTANSHTLLTSGTDTQEHIAEIRAGSLDVQGGFTHFRARLSDPSAAAIIDAMDYIFLDPVNPGDGILTADITA